MMYLETVTLTKSQSGARGGRDADVKIFTGSAQNAQD